MANKPNKNFNVTGKVCLITGAARGLGRHFAKVLANAGATVIASSLRSEMNSLESLVIEITQEQGQVIPFELDVNDCRLFEKKVSELVSQTGQIDILINNAGVSYYTNFFETTEEDWDTHIDINLKGAFFLAKAVAKTMVDKQRLGSIINIGSIAGSQAKKYHLPFCVSKAGLHHLTKVMAYELVEYGIRVNAISPGLFPTELVTDYIKTEAGKNFIDQIPMKRPGKLDELDGALLLLASDASAYMTGTIIEVDGGFSIDLFLREAFDTNKNNVFFKSK